jgi:hypothetical protein
MMPRVVSSTLIAMLVVARAKEPSRLATGVEGTRHKEIAADVRRQVLQLAKGRLQIFLDADPTNSDR